MRPYSEIDYLVADRIATITLSRPDQLNVSASEHRWAVAAGAVTRSAAVMTAAISSISPGLLRSLTAR